jgi:hypothetical protein
MKAKLATAISVIGVLGAGSAAAMVNTQILDSNPTESGASKAVLPPAPTVEVSVPSVTDPIEVGNLQVVEVVRDSTTTTVPATTTTPATTAPATQPSDLLTSFNVGEAGVVTVDVIDGQLVLVSAEPKSGWAVTKAEDDSNDDSDEQHNEVDVEFVSATVRVEFGAEYIDGRIVPHVESKSIGGQSSNSTSAAAPAGPAPAQGPTVGGDDDEHDDHEDDDHEDDDHEDEHHEDDEHQGEHEDERDDD